MKPPSGGPSTGATSPGQTIVPIAVTRWRLSVIRSTISRPTGTIAAPPAPWTKRAAVKVHRPRDRPQRIEATVNSAIAPPTTVRGPNRSAIQPLIGMNTASATR